MMPAGLVTGVAQACEDTIDELTLGAVEIQGFFAIHQCVYSLFQSIVSLGHSTPDDGACLGAPGQMAAQGACNHLRPASAVTGRLKSFRLSRVSLAGLLCE